MLPDILLSLYSTSSSKILSVLNESIYITDFDKNDDTILFHTGFRFKTHKGTEFDVYYDLDSKSIIRQTVGPYSRKSPLLIGFLCGIGDNKYIEKTYYWLVTTINISELQDTNDDNVLKGLSGNNLEDLESLVTGNSPITETILVTDAGQRGLHKSFQIVKADGDTTTLPLQKIFSRRIYFDTHKFSLYEPEHFIKSNSYDNDESNGDFWTCDACGGSSNTGCMSSTGECYR